MPLFVPSRLHDDIRSPHPWLRISHGVSDQIAVFEQAEPHLRREFELAPADGSMAGKGSGIPQTRAKNRSRGGDRRANSIAYGADHLDRDS